MSRQPGRQRKHRLPRTPGQCLAISAFGCVLLGLLCTWHYWRYDSQPMDTMLLKPVPDKPLINKANRHILMVPFLSLIVGSGVVGAIVLFNRKRAE